MSDRSGRPATQTEVEMMQAYTKTLDRLDYLERQVRSLLSAYCDDNESQFKEQLMVLSNYISGTAEPE